MMRIDSRVDCRNSLNWHQNAPHCLQNKSGLKGLTCWAPMHEVNSNNGTLLFLKDAQELGNIKTEPADHKEHFFEQFEIDDSVVRRYETKDLVSSFGYVNFLSMDVVHRPGLNQSNSFRIVAGARYHNMYVSDFHTGQLRYVYL